MTTELATTQQVTVLSRREVQALDFTDAQRQLIRDAYAKGANDEEFAVLMEIARARALNPLLRQVFFVSRWDSKLGRETWATQVSIDGLRAIAERTGLYAGQDEPEFVEGPDGAIKSCKVRVYRKDWPRPAVGVAYFDEYVQTTTDKATRKTVPAKFWRQMPHVMIAKCAESLAIRKAFPEDTANLYTPEEMGQADNDATPRRGRSQLDGAPEARQLSDGHPAATPEVEGSVEPEDIAPPTCADLAGLRAWYTGLGLAADDSRAAGEALGLAVDHLVALGYLMNSVEESAACAGTLAPLVIRTHDLLAAESTPEGVVRAYGKIAGEIAACPDKDLRGDCKRTAARYYGMRSAPQIKGKAAQEALAAALAPTPQPPTPPAPTGTDAPRSTPAAAEGGGVAPSATAGAQAITRTVLDADEAEARLVSSATAWAEHLARHVEARSPVFTLAGGYHKRRAAFVEAGVATARYEATLAAIEAREGRGPDRARECLDGYATRQVMSPGVGDVIHLRSHREIVAARTGTDG